MTNAGRTLPPPMAVVAGAFRIGAVPHPGWRVDVGAAVLAGPRIVVAAMAEAASGVATAVGAVGQAAGLPWGRAGAIRSGRDRSVPARIGRVAAIGGDAP